MELFKKFQRVQPKTWINIPKLKTNSIAWTGTLKRLPWWKEEYGNCAFCKGQEEDNLVHYLVKCPLFDEERKKLRLPEGSGEEQVKHALKKENAKNLIKFIAKSGTKRSKMIQLLSGRH